MAYDYKYINTVQGNPRYEQTYAIEPHGSGAYHIYRDGTTEFVASPPYADVALASTWKPPQVTVLAGAAIPVAGGAPPPPSVVVDKPTSGIAPAAPPTPYPTTTINESTPASIAGVSYGTYQAEQNTLHESTPNSIAGISTTSTQSPQYPTTTINESTPASIAGVSTSIATSSVSGTSQPQTLQELPGKLQVTSGMNFWDLETRHGWPHGTLEQLNPGLNPKGLAVGTSINIPQATSTAGATGGNPATVASSVGPSSSGYDSGDSKLKAEVAAIETKAKTEGWPAALASESQDPAVKAALEAVAPPKVNTDPINPDRPHTV